MSKIISRYSKEQDLTKIEYSDYEKYVNSQLELQQEIERDDATIPYSYEEWIKRNIGIVYMGEYKQYSEYLKQWYKDHKEQASKVLESLKTDYKALIQQINLAFKNSIDEEYIRNINIDVDYELEEAIPYYVRKLKEIAIYFINKRDAIRKAKLKYNLSGARNALEKLFYEYLLKAFTKREYVLNVPEQSAWNTFSDLSAVNKPFKIMIEELYDDTNYLDKDPTVPLSSYYDTANPILTSYLYDLDFPLSAVDWLYSTGIIPLCANDPLLLNEEMTLDVYNKIAITQKYMGETKYILSGGYYKLMETDFEYEFNAGNNWFYWPSGEYIEEANITNVDSIALTSTTLAQSGATAGITYDLSDKIFIQVENDIQGAWLKYSKEETQTQNMSCTINGNESLFFKFPFPGYGTSGEDIEWNGKQISNIDNTFAFMDAELQDEVKRAYWTDVITNSAINVVNVQKSSLIDSGAYASQYFDLADQISVRNATDIDGIHDLSPNTVYHDEFQRAWLYKMLKTDIPITKKENRIYWPIERYTNISDVQYKVLSSQCAPISLSSINVEQTMIGARAGYGLADSDIIYKLETPNGIIATECAWLSGTIELSQWANYNTLISNATGFVQPSLTLKCRSGEFVTFIWGDENTDINSTNIKHVDHQKDCLYLNISSYNSYYNDKREDLLNENNIQWKKCDCKSILYSPLGHPGSNYDEYNKYSDYVVLFDSVSSNAFNLDTWTGSDGKGYKESADFAWFKLSSTQSQTTEKDVGWKDGQWVNYNGSGTFYLKKGHQYRYYRNPIGFSQDELLQGDYVPYIIIKQPYGTKRSQWARAVLDNTGNWILLNEPSDMVINPGDYILYDHIDSNWYCLTAYDTRGNTYTPTPTTGNPEGESIWSNYTYATTGKNVTFLWPDAIYTNGPSAVYYELSSVKWTLTTPSSTTIHYMAPGQGFVVNITLPGIYSVNAIGYKTFDGTQIIANNIPTVTGVGVYNVVDVSGSIDKETIYADTINFVINVPLSGWSYTLHSYNPSYSDGARPFWANATDDDSRTTKYKGTLKWGGGLELTDDYNFISQPKIANIDLDFESYVEYYRNTSDDFIWIEPIQFKINEETKEWCKLLIYPRTQSPLKDTLWNIDSELVVSGTNIPSDIILSPEISGSKVLVNYWAQNSFTWVQTLTDSSLGIPPTGGRWIPSLTATLFDPDIASANLLNRHFPTIATIPYIPGLYSESDVGGYFLPKSLGINTYIGKSYVNGICAKTDDLIFSDPYLYANDQGLTLNDKNTVLRTQDYDATWMKSSIATRDRAGEIINANIYKEFIPYQTQVETQKTSYVGVRRSSDNMDPWMGSFDYEWRDEDVFPANFRGEHNIEKWYTDYDMFKGKELYKWKSDIFGNDYMMIKTPLSSNSINLRKENNTGVIYIRDLNGNISELINTISLSAALDSSILSSVSTQLVDFDIWYDILMLKTSKDEINTYFTDFTREDYLIFTKLNFDYESNILNSNVDQTFIIELKGGSINRFYDYNDGTIIDSYTDLMWTKNADICGVLTYAQATATIVDFNNMNYCGYSDWRLPILKSAYFHTDYEFESLGYNDGGYQTGTWITPSTPFINVYTTSPTPVYCTSLYTYGGIPKVNIVLCISMVDGSVASFVETLPLTPQYHVWPVREATDIVSETNPFIFNDIWFFEQDKNIIINCLSSVMMNISGDKVIIPLPVFYNVNIDTLKLSQVALNVGDYSEFYSLSTYMLTSHEQPVFTYDSVYKRFNVTFFADALIGNKYNVTYTMNYYDKMYLNNISVITPVEYND